MNNPIFSYAFQHFLIFPQIPVFPVKLSNPSFSNKSAQENHKTLPDLGYRGWATPSRCTQYKICTERKLTSLTQNMRRKNTNFTNPTNQSEPCYKQENNLTYLAYSWFYRFPINLSKVSENSFGDLRLRLRHLAFLHRGEQTFFQKRGRRDFHLLIIPPVGGKRGEHLQIYQLPMLCCFW